MSWRGATLALHRDLGFFFTGVMILYAVSGLAVNHADQWNPNYSVASRPVTLDLPDERSAIDDTAIHRCVRQLGIEEDVRGYDFPSDQRVKVYLTGGSITATLADGAGVYETVRQRPLLARLNALHLNPARWWRAFSDVFAVCLIVIAISGMVIVRGPHGLAGRGKWLVAAGLVFPLAAMFCF